MDNIKVDQGIDFSQLNKSLTTLGKSFESLSQKVQAFKCELEAIDYTEEENAQDETN